MVAEVKTVVPELRIVTRGVTVSEQIFPLAPSESNIAISNASIGMSGPYPFTTTAPELFESNQAFNWLVLSLPAGFQDMDKRP
ncbi:hypothetical protein D3C86_1783880 [compost metagenome]